VAGHLAQRVPRFPDGRHDDQVDSTSQALSYLTGRTHPPTPLRPRASALSTSAGPSDLRGGPASREEASKSSAVASLGEEPRAPRAPYDLPSDAETL